LTAAPTSLSGATLLSESLPTAADLGLAADLCPERQSGGRRLALETLESFLSERGRDYRTDMSSPVSGASGCSRLSPHLAWGTVAMREVAAAVRLRQAELSAGEETKAWRASLRSYTGRLHWHCHFMQKLEDEPRLEFENLHPAYEGLRGTDQARLEAWQRGETGWPFVDACMRSLAATGWLNFRMRAMLVAVASYHLWLDWRATGEHLARYFTDYEPGIHWPQVQMQSGTTGINAVRIYNPIKQGHDQDPTGAFVRRWVPELAAVPDEFVQEPWRWSEAGKLLDRHYPAPILDHQQAARDAKARIWSLRGNAEHKQQAAAIQKKHGSRKRRTSRRSPNHRQAELPFDQGSSA
ncbi:MAG: FAD-binding domain-containing protein, partial [Pseudomonadota bacterium]